MERRVCGLIGKVCAAKARTHWNKLFTDRALDAFFDFYRTSNLLDLELRLSEMFLLSRRGYIVGKELQGMVAPLLDKVDISAEKSQKVDTIVNDNGILTGFFTGEGEGSDESRLRLWFP